MLELNLGTFPERMFRELVYGCLISGNFDPSKDVIAFLENWTERICAEVKRAGTEKKNLIARMLTNLEKLHCMRNTLAEMIARAERHASDAIITDEFRQMNQMHCAPAHQNPLAHDLTTRKHTPHPPPPLLSISPRHTTLHPLLLTCRHFLHQVHHNELPVLAELDDVTVSFAFEQSVHSAPGSGFARAISSDVYWTQE